MKWYGVYRQKPKESGYFMMRTPHPRRPAHRRASRQAFRGTWATGSATVSATSPRGMTIQYHWLRIEEIPTIFSASSQSGRPRTTSGACGDDRAQRRRLPRRRASTRMKSSTPRRNFSGGQQPLHSKTTAISPTSRANTKSASSGCNIHCAQPDINCVGVFGLKRTVNGQIEERGFGIKVGGGLSSAPKMSGQILQGLPPAPRRVLGPSSRPSSKIYRDHGYRH